MKVWTRKESKERFPRAISPLGWSLLQVPLEASLEQMSESLGVKKYSKDEMILWHNYYVYTRKDFFTNIKNLRFRPGPLLKISTGIVWGILKSILTAPFVKDSFKSHLSQNIALTLYSRKIASLISSWPSQVAMFKKVMGRDHQLDAIKMIDFETFIRIRNQMQEDSKIFFAEDFNVYFLKHILLSVLKTALTAKEISALTSGLSGNFAIEMVEDFNNQNLTIGDLKLKFGHLTNNWDLYGPTLSEEESIWKERKQQKEIVRIKQETNLKGLEPRLRLIVSQLCELIIMDEDLRAYSSLQYPQARKLMALVTRHPAWISTGLPENAIYFLSLQEIEEGLKNKSFHPYVEKIEKRIFEFNTAEKIEPPFEITEEGKELSLSKKKSESSQKEFSGSVISPGKIKGKVTFIKNYEDLPKLTKENIIVIESATPVYAPFYTTCGGIISEMGGQLSHGAIVAREYGIPMISDVEDACILLKEGQPILLDADTGIVRILHG